MRWPLSVWLSAVALLPAMAADPPTNRNVDAAKAHWAYQPVKCQPNPQVKNADWPRGDIDRFILAKLEANGITPAGDASRVALIRRAYFDLIGLPPTPEQIDAFVSDRSPGAFTKVVDGLLASPRFGERWGRHWLDVARYADSSGGGRSLLFKDAWRYRDYVINSFNADKPFDRFVTEQIAGDLLPSATRRQREEQVIASGFLVLGPTNYELQDKEILESDVIDEQIDTIGQAFLGMTIGCARCHDHKFDPIPTRDYYALAGILRNTQTLIHDNVSRWVDLPLPVSPEEEAALKKKEAAVAALKERIRLAKSAEKKAGVRRTQELEAELKKLEASGPVRPVAMSVKETPKIEDYYICVRGVVHNRGPAVPRGFLPIATIGAPPKIPANESGRRQLAKWLVSPTNPLTARVAVNRIWHYLFGAGIVRTVDQFGVTGEPPSHPELLDYLAMRFIDNGWSVKKLIRDIMLSHVYQLASDRPVAADPENRLLSRMNRRRLDAECIRDAILQVSGQLDSGAGGPAFEANANEVGYRFTSTRRSVYLPVFRNRLPEIFEAFDFPDPNLVGGKRNVSTVSTQALLLLNNPFLMEQAKHAATRIVLQSNRSDLECLNLAYRTALGRLPTEGERRLMLAFVKEADSKEKRSAAWERIYQALFACIDFRYED